MIDQASAMLLSLALILIVTRSLGALSAKLGQPTVIGEVLGGVLLSPTMFHGRLSSILFPPDIRPYLTALANLGVVLFMFMVGLQLDHSLVKAKVRSALAVSIGSTVLPLGLGMLLALYLFAQYPTGSRLGFVLFLGACMSITAFPVLARVLHDARLEQTTLGGLALASASIGDVLTWSLLAVVVAVVSGTVHWQLLLVMPYLVLMFTVVPRILARLTRSGDPTGPLSRTSFAAVLMGVLVSSAFTEFVGLHFIFGAFLFGAVMPRDLGLRKIVLRPVEQLSLTLLLPIYFVVAGLQVNLSDVGLSGLLNLLVIVAVAAAGKLLGSFAGAKTVREPTNSAIVLGVLMNTRGLTELIILTVGLQLHVLDNRLYSLMVAMALITTSMTGPLLRLTSRYDPALQTVTFAPRSATARPAD